ncbi:hypothetical protein RISK_003776 [Rhodopirellula islandica]|uniref:Uncharacterized protein n=1 Tax=Rhodopirellula islandica TaxID=595434 RepID=A0A0J1BC23_RHOIS|nr:hypothetical protein RISK_003776 [Rhodopirellula islandica]
MRFQKSSGIRWCFSKTGARVGVSYTDIGDASICCDAHLKPLV